MTTNKSLPAAEEPFTDVHTAHCCKFHGCKYSWDDVDPKDSPCSVINGRGAQEYICEECQEELADHASFLAKIQDLPQILKRIKEIEAIREG